jgi:hypothetical protein
MAALGSYRPPIVATDTKSVCSVPNILASQHRHSAKDTQDKLQGVTLLAWRRRAAGPKAPLLSWLDSGLKAASFAIGALVNEGRSRIQD